MIHNKTRLLTLRERWHIWCDRLRQQVHTVYTDSRTNNRYLTFLRLKCWNVNSRLPLDAGPYSSSHLLDDHFGATCFLGLNAYGDGLYFGALDGPITGIINSQNRLLTSTHMHRLHTLE